MKNIIYILLVLTIASCDVQKISDKTKDNSNYKENIEVKTFRQGDTVRFEIPKIQFKDTIIYRTNKQGTTIKTVYNEQGTVKSIDCYASRIEELTRQNIEYQKSIKQKQSVKTEKFNTIWVLYFIIGFVIVFIVALLLMFLYIKKNTAVVSAFLSK